MHSLTRSLYCIEILIHELIVKPTPSTCYHNHSFFGTDELCNNDMLMTLRHFTQSLLPFHLLNNLPVASVLYFKWQFSIM